MTPDITIIGGGPAGSSTAIRLARARHRVRLYERKVFPRPKLCGGFLSPETRQSLAELHVLEDVLRSGAVPITRLVVSAPSGKIAEAFLPTPALSFSREGLD